MYFKTALLLLFIYTGLPAITPEERIEDTMLEVNHYYYKKNAMKILYKGNQLLDWGETGYAQKCIEKARELVIAKNSWAEALYIAGMYQKMHDEKMVNYWIKVSEYLQKKQKKKWKKN